MAGVKRVQESKQRNGEDLNAPLFGSDTISAAAQPRPLGRRGRRGRRWAQDFVEKESGTKSVSVSVGRFFFGTDFGYSVSAPPAGQNSGARAVNELAEIFESDFGLLGSRREPWFRIRSLPRLVGCRVVQFSWVMRDSESGAIFTSHQGHHRPRTSLDRPGANTSPA